jgi:hypothetical protein
MEITIEQLTKAIRSITSGESIDPKLVELGLTESWVSLLIHAHYNVESSSRGGCSDWTGGGNPHRIMEELDHKKAWDWFETVCEELNLDPWDCRCALRNGGAMYEG